MLREPFSRKLWGVLFCATVAVWFLSFCGQAFATSFDCSIAKNLSDKTICSNPFLSRVDERDALLYQKAIPIAPLAAFAVRKESLAGRLSCGGNVQCLKRLYEVSSRGYQYIIDSPSRAKKMGNTGQPPTFTTQESKPPVVHDTKRIPPQQSAENQGMLIVLLFIGMFAFVVTWKIFDFFFSLHDVVDMSPVQYYVKKIGTSFFVSILSLLTAIYWLF